MNLFLDIALNSPQPPRHLILILVHHTLMQELSKLIIHPPLPQIPVHRILHSPVQSLEISSRVRPESRSAARDREDVVDLEVVGPGGTDEGEDGVGGVGFGDLDEEGDAAAEVALVAGAGVEGDGGVEHGGVELDLLAAGGVVGEEAEPLLAGAVVDPEGREGLRRGTRGVTGGEEGQLAAEEAEEVAVEGRRGGGGGGGG